MKGDISELLFRHRKTRRAYRIFLDWLKGRGCEASPKDVSRFAWDLQNGSVAKDFKYQRTHFYRTVLRRLLDLGFISKQSRYPNRVVYAPVIQPIPKRTPLLTTWWGFAYLVAEKWNLEFEEMKEEK